jgi:hypothetical protein
MFDEDSFNNLGGDAAGIDRDDDGRGRRGGYGGDRGDGGRGDAYDSRGGGQDRSDRPPGPPRRRYEDPNEPLPMLNKIYPGRWCLFVHAIYWRGSISYIH